MARITTNERFDLIGAVPGKQGTAVKVMACLAKRANNDTGVCWPGRAEIARYVFGSDAKHCQDKVTRAVKLLEANGLIRVRRNARHVGGGTFVNEYELIPRKEVAPREGGDVPPLAAGEASGSGSQGHYSSVPTPYRAAGVKQLEEQPDEQPGEQPEEQPVGSSHLIEPDGYEALAIERARQQEELLAQADRLEDERMADLGRKLGITGYQ